MLAPPPARERKGLLPGDAAGEVAPAGTEEPSVCRGSFGTPAPGGEVEIDEAVAAVEGVGTPGRVTREPPAARPRGDGFRASAVARTLGASPAA